MKIIGIDYSNFLVIRGEGVFAIVAAMSVKISWGIGLLPILTMFAECDGYGTPLIENLRGKLSFQC